MKKIFLLSLVTFSGAIFGADSDSGMETSPVKKAIDGAQLVRNAAMEKHETTYDSKGNSYNQFKDLCAEHRVNAKDSFGMTALHYAVLKKHSDNVQTLLCHGANPNTLNAKGESPLYLARAGNAQDIEEQLRRAGALDRLIGGKVLPQKEVRHLPASRH